MATYGQIQDWVQREHGFLPKTGWIAHCMEPNGLPLRTGWNRAGGRQEPCPEEKRAVVFAAFRHFGMAG